MKNLGEWLKQKMIILFECFACMKILGKVNVVGPHIVSF